MASILKEYDTAFIAGTKSLNGGRDRKAQKPMIAKVIVHPEYRLSNKTNDIALLVIKEELEWTDLVKPNTLPPQGTQIDVGREGVISGWGVTEYGNLVQSLRYAKVKTIEIENCTKMHITRPITNEMFCARASNVTFCYGDYGGPFVIDNILHGRSHVFQEFLRKYRHLSIGSKVR